MDIQWKEHLATMDHLRQGIYLVIMLSVILQEYKRESYEIFTTILDNIKFEIIKKLQLVHIKEKVSAPHNDFSGRSLRLEEMILSMWFWFKV